MLRLTYAIQTHPGKIRESNEDNFYWNGRIRADVDQKQDGAEGRENIFSTPVLAAVCDGMGGEARGELASLIAVKNLRACPFSEAQSTARASIQRANAEICDEIEKNDGRRMGSTLAALYIEKDRAVCCNVGDSRVYQLRKDVLTQLSVDHNRVQQLISLGAITPEEARTHKSRHVLTQHLGIFEDEMILSPAFSEEIVLEPGDIYLLCSDGLTDMLTDEEIREILCSIFSAERQTELLVEKALERGGRDNVTVIVIRVDEAEMKKTLWSRMLDMIRR